MKAISEHLYIHGKHCTAYYRRRIPNSLRRAYPSSKTHITLSLHTSDLREAKRRAERENVKVDAEFERIAKELRAQMAQKESRRLQSLSDEQLQGLAQYWVQQVLETDDRTREQGLDDDEFEELGKDLTQQRQDLGRMLSQGQAHRIQPALQSFLFMCGLEVDFTPEAAKRAGRIFLQSVVTALDHRLARQEGQVVPVPPIASPGQSPREVGSSIAPQNKTWEEVFVVWRDYVKDRPKSTAIATQTPWRALEAFAKEFGIHAPAEMTEDTIRGFVSRMSEKGLATVTLNARLDKIKALLRVARSKGVVPHNPAEHIIGLKESTRAKRVARRLPFEQADIQKIFSSDIYNDKQLRSSGQSAEATYWLPLIMYFTGARPEEIAGLAVSDVVCDEQFGWYFNITDRPEPDTDLFESSKELAEKQKGNSRFVKNVMSIRVVPVAPELIRLGFIRYIEFVRQGGNFMLFPELKKDWHGKFCGAFGKFFGRFKKDMLGISNPKKVLYSLRHTFKDFMVAVNLETKMIHRIMGHASGDGVITDGYGKQDIPLEFIVREFKKIKYFEIDAQPWTVGRGMIRVSKGKKLK